MPLTDLKPPIILLGNVRSGTTMMHNLFDTHPRVKSWFEPRTIWTYAAPRRKHDRFTESDATPRVQEYIRKRFLQYQRENGNRRVMEKTPSNILRVPYVHAIFPESKLLYVIREPFAQLSSADLRWSSKTGMNRHRALERIKETPKTQLPLYLGRFVADQFRGKVLRKRISYFGVRYPGFQNDLKSMTLYEVLSKQWAECSQQCDADLDGIDPDLVLRLRYEDFVADPIPNFTRICEHFDLDMTPEMEAKLRNWVDPGRQDKWRRFDKKTLELCLPILAKEMMRKGYELPDIENHQADEDMVVTTASGPNSASD